MNSEAAIRVAIVSLGCPKNLIDSEKICAHLAEGGCVVAAPMDEADVIVVNTCGFLSAARDESLEVIAEALACKETGRAKRVVVAGCLVNRDAEELFDLAEGIDAVVGVNDRDAILSAVTGKRRTTLISPPGRAVSDAGRFRLTPRHTAYLRIAEGCDQKCTFCTIPAIRGPFRSKLPADVLAEAAELIADGAVELNVIAQDTTSYGMDLARPTDLASLLGELDDLPGAAWIRLMYAYPIRFTDKLIDTIAAAEHVLPYVDIPLQHIAGGVLRRMGRGVARREVEDLLGKLRQRVADVTIRTTFIVGFPGETDAEFAELLEFVREFGFEAMGVFEFSPEEGTPAAGLAGAVADDVKADRAEQLMLAQQAVAFDANERAVGRVIDVLVDGVDNDGRSVGRHGGQAPEVDSVCLLTGPAPAGEIISAEVVGWDEYDLLVRPAGDQG